MNTAVLRRSVLLAGALFGLWGSADFAGAAVVFNDFGAGDTFDSTGGQTFSVLTNTGTPFTPTAAASITDITVALKAAADTTITLTICSNTNSHPGAAISSTTVNVSGTGTPQVLHATFAAPAAVVGGTMYWVKAAPGGGTSSGPATWMYNTAGQFGYASQLGTGSWVAANGPGLVVRLEDNSAPPTGACCNGSTCTLTLAPACNAQHTRFAGVGVACNAAANTQSPCCKGDFNQSGGLEVQDIFDYLNAWFAGSAAADINGSGLAVQDIFDFLNAWFAGC